MGRQRGQTSMDERKLIIHHYNGGKSLREIGTMVNRSHATVQSVINRFKSGLPIENKKRNSTRKIFDTREERWILRKVRNDPKISAPKLAIEVEKWLRKTVNPETIRNVLRNNGLHGRIARKKPFINKNNRNKRLQYVKEHAHKNFDYWKDVLFTDESKFNLFGSDGRVNVWRRPNEEMSAKNLRPTVKQGGGSVMVWGCMSYAGVGNLHFIDGIMDQYVYLNILREELKDSASNLEILRSFKFYQDNDPKHKAYNIRNWLLYNFPKFIETPPQSPDLNAIENLWSYLDVAIRKHPIHNKGDLKQALLKEWAAIPSSYCEKLVQSMPNRLSSVQRNKGYPTKY